MTLPGAAPTSTTRRTRRHRRILITAFAVASLFHASATSARAQTPTPTPDAADDEVIRIDTDLVTVPFVVTDKGGRRVHGLAREEFLVTDGGRPAEVVYFAAGAERVAMLFLLDASGSTRDLIAAQRDAALALFSRFGPRSRFSVLSFQERPGAPTPFTSDPAAAAAAFRFGAQPGRRTAIFDAALAAVRAFDAAGSERAERRLVVLISDGLDTASTVRPAAVIDAADRRGVSFYVIHTPLYEVRDGRLRPRATAKGFRDLAEKTGGQVFSVEGADATLGARQPADFGPVFQAIEYDLRGQYVVGFYSSGVGDSSPAEQRRVEVGLRTSDARRLRVRALRDAYVLRRQ